MNFEKILEDNFINYEIGQEINIDDFSQGYEKIENEIQYFLHILTDNENKLLMNENYKETINNDNKNSLFAIDNDQVIPNQLQNNVRYVPNTPDSSYLNSNLGANIDSHDNHCLKQVNSRKIKKSINYVNSINVLEIPKKVENLNLDLQLNKEQNKENGSQNNLENSLIVQKENCTLSSSKDRLNQIIKNKFEAKKIYDTTFEEGLKMLAIVERFAKDNTMITKKGKIKKMTFANAVKTNPIRKYKASLYSYQKTFHKLIYLHLFSENSYQYQYELYKDKTFNKIKKILSEDENLKHFLIKKGLKAKYETKIGKIPQVKKEYDEIIKGIEIE